MAIDHWSQIINLIWSDETSAVLACVNKIAAVQHLFLHNLWLSDIMSNLDHGRWVEFLEAQTQAWFDLFPGLSKLELMCLLVSLMYTVY